jgi:hypothetical protein
MATFEAARTAAKATVTAKSVKHVKPVSADARWVFSIGLTNSGKIRD